MTQFGAQTCQWSNPSITPLTEQQTQQDMFALELPLWFTFIVFPLMGEYWKGSNFGPCYAAVL